MARDKGQSKFSSNFEVKIAEMLDPRLLVDAKEELIKKDTWPSDGNTIYMKEGMFVYVKGDGFYELISLANILAEDYSGWKKVTSGGVNENTSQRIDDLEDYVGINNVKEYTFKYVDADNTFGYVYETDLMPYSDTGYRIYIKSTTDKDGIPLAITVHEFDSNNNHINISGFVVTYYKNGVDNVVDIDRNGLNNGNTTAVKFVLDSGMSMDLADDIFNDIKVYPLLSFNKMFDLITQSDIDLIYRKVFDTSYSSGSGINIIGEI